MEHLLSDSLTERVCCLLLATFRCYLGICISIIVHANGGFVTRDRFVLQRISKSRYLFMNSCVFQKYDIWIEFIDSLGGFDNFCNKDKSN